jgi:hypothetical protein
MAHPDQELVRRDDAAFTTADGETLQQVFAATTVVPAPGHRPISGGHQGLDQVLGFFGALAERSGGTFRASLQDVVATDDHAVGLPSSDAEGDGRAVAVQRCWCSMSAMAGSPRPGPTTTTSTSSTPSRPRPASRSRSGHKRAVAGTLVSNLRAGITILKALRRNPMVSHASLATPGGWNQSVRFCRGETTFDRATQHRSVGAALRLIAGADRPEHRGA